MDRLQTPLEDAHKFLQELDRPLNDLLRLKDAGTVLSHNSSTGSPSSSLDMELILTKQIDSLISTAIQRLFEFQFRLRQTTSCGETFVTPHSNPVRTNIPKAHFNTLDKTDDGTLQAPDSFGHDPGGQTDGKSPSARAELPHPPVIRHKRDLRKDTIPGDLWSWRKYGQKELKWEGVIRRYFKCMHQDGGLTCPAKRQVDRVGSKGRIVSVMYEGIHNHEPPEPRTTIIFQDGENQEVQ